MTRRVFSAGAAAAGLGALVRPAQAGPAWRVLPTEPYRGKQDDIAFIDPDRGWYGNGAGKLYRTVDGGASWTLISERPGTFIRALGFLDDKVGFLGNVGVDYYPNVADRHPLYRTDDGGLSWAPVEADGIGAVAGICGVDILRTRRIFQGELRETAVVHAAGRVGGPAALLRSQDGGATWRVIDLSAHAGMALDVKFLTPRKGFIAGQTPSEAGDGEALMLATTDGGASWKSVYRSGRKLENCWKMSFPTDRTGFATVQSYDPANPQRVVIKTTDGGMSWEELPLTAAPAMQEFGVGFVDEDRGWVGCRSGGFETLDGGAHWSPCAMGQAVNKIRVLRDGARTRVFAIGLGVARLDL